MSRLIELRGFAFLDGKVVVVGKATQEKDHGTPCWMCSTMPPLEQRHVIVGFRSEARDWLKKVAGAEEVFEGSTYGEGD
jgi:hypothetical protein